jgi:hypothetical protein
MEDYSRISLKGMVGLSVLCLPRQRLSARLALHFWPVPTSGIYEIHVLVKAELAGFTDLSDDVNLPPEYQEAIMYNLAARLRPHYQLPPDPSITASPSRALNTIRVSNTQIATLLMPAGLHRSRELQRHHGRGVLTMPRLPLSGGAYQSRSLWLCPTFGQPVPRENPSEAIRPSR